MNAGPFRPVMCCGKTAATTLSVAAAAGANVITVASGGGYVVGELVFVSNADDSAVQFLGTVTNKNVSVLTLSLGLQVAREIGAKVWRPSTRVAWSRGADQSVTRLRATGTEVQVSRGGQVTATQTSDPVESLEYSHRLGLSSDWEAWKGFVVTSRQDGLLPFTLAWWDSPAGVSRCDAVRWGGGELSVSYAGARRDVAVFRVGLFLLEPDEYVLL